MKKFENVNLTDSLYEIMLTNTVHYQSDFDYDKEILKKAAESEDIEDKSLLFMSRPSGTYCFREKDVFIKDTPQYNTWKFYGEQTKDKILAYAIRITGVEDGRIKGNLYELNYQQHFKHVIQTALQADNQEELKYVLEGEHRSNEKLPRGDIDRHIEQLGGKRKTSIRKQLAENKGKSEPKKAITQKKEDISL